MIQDIFRGISSYLKAFSVISEMRLWKYLLIPGLISLFLGGSIFGLAWGFSGNLGFWLQSWYPFTWGAATIASIADWLGLIIILLVGMVAYKHIIMVLVSPFMSPLSQKVEENLSGVRTNNSGFQIKEAIKDLVRGLRIALRNIVRELFFVIVLIVLGFIPVISWLSGILIFLVQAYYAGFGNMDYTLERHFKVKGSAQFVRAHRGLAIGNGTVFLLLLMTGVGFLFAPPLATVAATLETTKHLDRSGAYDRQESNYV